METATEPKVTCSACRKKLPISKTVEVGSRRSGSYNRAGSWGTTTVCEKCTIEQVDYTRTQQFLNGRYWATPLNKGIKWSEAANHFGIYWDDLPKDELTPAKIKPENS